MSEKTHRHPYLNGWDHYHTDPGKLERAECRVCGAEMTVTRNVDGPTSMAESMAGRSHLHDSFACPNVQEDWHAQARSLKEQAHWSHSAVQTKQLTDEAEEIIRQRKATKEVYF